MLAVIFITTSCKDWRYRLPNVATSEMQDKLADAHPDFREGWRDGCQVGTASGANSFYQMFYAGNKVNGYKVTESPEYQSAWNGAYWFCYRYQYVKNKSSLWRSFFGGYR